MIIIPKLFLHLIITVISIADEVLYYVDGDFMSRNDIDAGHISLHPAGIPHGPHPGAQNAVLEIQKPMN